MTQTHTIKFEVGDWSDDGHGKTDDIYFKSNKDGDEVESLYGASVKMHGLDITCECDEYEDSCLSGEYLEKAREIFGSYPEVLKLLDDIEDGEMYMDSDTFVTLYMWTAKLMSADLEFEQTRPDYKNIIRPGGYGLFS